MHPDYTCVADRVVYAKHSKPHVAFVTAVNADDSHVADLVFYCTVDHAWKEAPGVRFGVDFTNPEA